MWTTTDCDQTVEQTASQSDSEWETVGHPSVQKHVTFVDKAPQRWCRDGNACPWSDCKFRHERCTHYDNWIARGKKGHNCRCHATDPESNKSPRDGGCKYDHRDAEKLTKFLEPLPCTTEEEMWDNFYQYGLDHHFADVYDIRKMDKLYRGLLIRSLAAAEVDFEEGDECVIIYAWN